MEWYIWNEELLYSDDEKDMALSVREQSISIMTSLQSEVLKFIIEVLGFCKGESSI